MKQRECINPGCSVYSFLCLRRREEGPDLFLCRLRIKFVAYDTLLLHGRRREKSKKNKTRRRWRRETRGGVSFQTRQSCHLLSYSSHLRQIHKPYTCNFFHRLIQPSSCRNFVITSHLNHKKTSKLEGGSYFVNNSFQSQQETNNVFVKKNILSQVKFSTMFFTN